MKPAKVAGLAVGLAAFALVLLIPMSLAPPARRALAVLLLMMALWFTEAIPIYWTALLPLALYPPLRVVKIQDAALPYADGFIFLFLGGMVIACAMEQSGLHRRIALHIMRLIGTEPRRLLLGFLVATAFISMWISNTATATMMLPIGMAVIAELEAETGRRMTHYGCAIMLTIAYGANIGGVGTVIGTAPNAQFAGFVAKHLGRTVDFFEFLLIGVPFVILFLPLAWWAVWRVGRREGLDAATGRAAIGTEIAKMGPMKIDEKFVLAIFAMTALLWTLSQPISARIRIPSKQWEWGVALGAAFLLVSWRLASFANLRRVPWETLLLLGGSFSMAAGIEKSGLAAWTGGRLSLLSGLPPIAQIGVAAMAGVFISAFASNTATIALLLPLLHGLFGKEAFPALAVATIATSCDFMLPAGTPPNAIVFGSGYVTIPRMMKTGVVLDLAAAAVATAWVHFGVRMLL